MILPSREAEQQYLGPVAGVDEVGRGPLAGPVIAAAVILPGPPLDLRPERFSFIRDSKKMTPNQREEASSIILSTCQVGIGEVSPQEIDKHGILKATFIAMHQAITNLNYVPDHILIDGNQIPKTLPAPATSIIKGDATCLAIAAASVVAKVYRDRLMKKLSDDFPQYGWERNSGYGTEEHREAIRQYGPTIHHRRSFSWGLEKKSEQLSLF